MPSRATDCLTGFPTSFTLDCCNRLGRAREQPVDPAKNRILLVENGRDIERACGKQRRKGRVAAKAHHRVRAELAVKRLGLASPLEHRARGLEPANWSSAQAAGRQDMGRHVLEQGRDPCPSIVGYQHDAVAARLEFGGERVSWNHVSTGTSGG